MEYHYIYLLANQIQAILDGYKIVLRLPRRENYDFEVGATLVVNDYITGQVMFPALKLRITRKAEGTMPDDISAFSWEELGREGIRKGIEWLEYKEREKNDPNFFDPWGNPFGCSRGNHSAACRAMKELQRTWNALFYPDLYFPSQETQEQVAKNSLEEIIIQPVRLPQIYIYEFERIKEEL